MMILFPPLDRELDFPCPAWSFWSDVRTDGHGKSGENWDLLYPGAKGLGLS
jgi:hypothetical protein